MTKRCLLVLAIALLLGGYFRASGLFRGLSENIIFHPDSPKQVRMLDNYLHGNYVQHYDNLFADGYPYGLNRIDEACLRAGYPALRAWRSLTNPEHPNPPVPPVSNLYYWGRLLRVAYGLLTILLIHGAVRRFGGGAAAAGIAALLYAAAPLGATVTHAVTGDVGVDLFVALSIYALAAYTTKQRATWLLLAGAACGLAFACKYQGALALWMPALTVLLGLRGRRAALPAAARQAGVIAAGGLAGVLAANPALLLDPERTWKYMRQNFAFIRDYGAPPGVLELPFSERILYGLQHNLMLLLTCLGWGYLLCTLLAVLQHTRAYLLARYPNAQDPQPDRDPLGRAATLLAVVSFPLVATLLSAALKPAVQPFHFTFALPGMAVAAGMLLTATPWRRHPRLTRLALTVLLAATGAEALWTSLREDFFWRRPENTDLNVTFAEQVFRAEGHPLRRHTGGQLVKQFYTEPSVLPVFRNRPGGIKHPDADWWILQHQLPLPSIPSPVSREWIFVNGSIFPRHDRMFTIPASGPGRTYRADQSQPKDQPLLDITPGARGRWFHRTLVYQKNPKQLTLGLRTGRWPSRYRLRSGGTTQAGMLPPHSQTIITLPVIRPAFTFEGKHGNPDLYLLPLRFQAQLGPLWITLLENARERAIYERQGPDPEAAAPLPTIPPEELARRLAGLKFLDGEQPFTIASTFERLVGPTAPLPAGAYQFQARITNRGTANRLTLRLQDDAGVKQAVPAFEQEIPPGTHTLTWRFQKPFAPYDATLQASADTAGLVMDNWRLVPDPLSEPASTPPAPAADVAEAAAPPPLQPLREHFPGIGTLVGLAIPARMTSGAPLPYRVAFELDPAIRHRTFHEAAFFLHIRNDAGTMVAGLDYLLRDATLADHAVIWQETPLPDLPPGHYSVHGGMYNARTRDRFAFTPPEGLPHDAKRRSLRLATLVIE